MRADSGSLQFSLRGYSQQCSAFAGNDANARGGDSNSANTVAVPTADETEIYYLTPGRVNIRV